MLLFITPSEFDLRAITTFGLHAKPNSRSPIGQFGTGLKYAIAVTLRLGGSVHIHQPGQAPHRFETRSAIFRGKSIEEIWRVRAGEAERMPFALNHGLRWTDLMAFREFESNTRDEGGRTFHFIKPVEVMAHLQEADSHGETVIVVEGLDKAWYQRDEMFLPDDMVPLWDNGVIQVLPRRGKNVYLKGVKVLELTKPSHYSYNILNPEAMSISLTEDRTIDEYAFALCSGNQLRQCTNLEVLATLIKPGADRFEHRVDLDWGGGSDLTPSAFQQYARVMQDFSEGVNPSARKLAQKLDLVMTGRDLLPHEREHLDAAIATCEKLTGWDVQEFPVAVVEELGSGILGLARHGHIYLAHAALQGSLFDLTSTIVEEYVHLKFQLRDCSREMQQFLFNRWLEVAGAANGLTGFHPTKQEESWLAKYGRVVLKTDSIIAINTEV